jgi:predicted RNase H-like nuclease
MWIGVDGCKHGWIAVEVNARGFREAGVFATFEALLARSEEAEVIAVDIPIGLVDGERDADRCAREFLKGQASSVFSTPPRAVLAAPSYERAQQIARELIGKGVSRQALALGQKILDVDAHASDARVHEVHPELSFRLMNGGVALDHRKKSWGGLRARLRLLREHGIELPDSIGEADQVGIDDVVDAAAAAWSARRIATKRARCFPGAPVQRDRAGRRIAIWA